MVIRLPRRTGQRFRCSNCGIIAWRSDTRNHVFLRRILNNRPVSDSYLYSYPSYLLPPCPRFGRPQRSLCARGRIERPRGTYRARTIIALVTKGISDHDHAPWKYCTYAACRDRFAHARASLMADSFVMFSILLMLIYLSPYRHHVNRKVAMLRNLNNWWQGVRIRMVWMVAIPILVVL